MTLQSEQIIQWKVTAFILSQQSFTQSCWGGKEIPCVCYCQKDGGSGETRYQRFRGKGDKQSHMHILGVSVTRQTHINVSWACFSSQTPLHLAAQKNQHFMVADLVSLGANINVKDRYGKTCLHLSAENGYIRVLEVKSLCCWNINIHSLLLHIHSYFNSLLTGPERFDEKWHIYQFGGKRCKRYKMVFAMLISVKISWVVFILFKLAFSKYLMSFGCSKALAAFPLPTHEKNPVVLVTNLLFCKPVVKEVTRLTMFCNQNLHYKGEIGRGLKRFEQVVERLLAEYKLHANELRICTSYNYFGNTLKGSIS